MKDTRGGWEEELLCAEFPSLKRCLRGLVTLAQSDLLAGCPSVITSLTPTVLHQSKSGPIWPTTWAPLPRWPSSRPC